MDRLKDLAKTNPDVYLFVLAWLSGAGDVDQRLAEQIDRAIDYVERTYRP